MEVASHGEEGERRRDVVVALDDLRRDGRRSPDSPGGGHRRPVHVGRSLTRGWSGRPSGSACGRQEGREDRRPWFLFDTVLFWWGGRIVCRRILIPLQEIGGRERGSTVFVLVDVDRREGAKARLKRPMEASALRGRAAHGEPTWCRRRREIFGHHNLSSRTPYLLGHTLVDKGILRCYGTSRVPDLL